MAQILDHGYWCQCDFLAGYSQKNSDIYWISPGLRRQWFEILETLKSLWKIDFEKELKCWNKETTNNYSNGIARLLWGYWAYKLCIFYTVYEFHLISHLCTELTSQFNFFEVIEAKYLPYAQFLKYIYNFHYNKICVLAIYFCLCIGNPTWKVFKAKR